MASRLQLGAIGFVVALCACYFSPSILAVKVKQADDGLRNPHLQQTAARQSNAGEQAPRKASTANQGEGNAPEAVEIDAVASEHLKPAAQSFNEVPAAQIDVEAAEIDAVGSQYPEPAAQTFNEVEALQAQLKEAKEKRVAAEEHLKVEALQAQLKEAKEKRVAAEEHLKVEALQAKLQDEKRVAADEHLKALQIEEKEHAADSALHGSEVKMMEKVANSADKVTEKATADVESDHEDDQQGRHIDEDNEGLQQVAQAPRLVELELLEEADMDHDADAAVLHNTDVNTPCKKEWGCCCETRGGTCCHDYTGHACSLHKCRNCPICKR